MFLEVDVKKDNLMLEIINLKKYYGKVRGVEDVSIQLKRGEVYGFIGPNGAGKSTTIRTLMNLINPTSGSIFIEGKKLNKNDLELKKMVGYLPSEICLYDDLMSVTILNSKLHKSRKWVCYYYPLSVYRVLAAINGYVGLQGRNFQRYLYPCVVWPISNTPYIIMKRNKLK